MHAAWQEQDLAPDLRSTGAVAKASQGLIPLPFSIRDLLPIQRTKKRPFSRFRKGPANSVFTHKRTLYPPEQGIQHMAIFARIKNIFKNRIACIW